MKNIIFIAPPAAGKGTISDYLVKNYHFLHISTGDLLREEIASGSKFGREIDEIIKRGSLVKDDIVIKLVENKLELKEPGKLFILDGFPRTESQAYSLDQMLEKKGIDQLLVIYLDAPLNVLLKRVMGRVICPKCKRSYNLNNEKLKPICDGICDDCGISLVKRDDDNEEIIKVRYESFVKDTKPILDFYQKKGILKEIDATIPLEDIYEIIKEEADIQVENGGLND